MLHVHRVNRVRKTHKASSPVNVDWALQTTTKVLLKSWLRMGRMMMMMMTKVLTGTSILSRSRPAKSPNPELGKTVMMALHYDDHCRLNWFDDGEKAEAPTADEEVSVDSSAVRASRRRYCCWSNLLVKRAAMALKAR